MSKKPKKPPAGTEKADNRFNDVGLYQALSPEFRSELDALGDINKSFNEVMKARRALFAIGEHLAPGPSMDPERDAWAITFEALRMFDIPLAADEVGTDYGQRILEPILKREPIAAEIFGHLRAFRRLLDADHPFHAGWALCLAAVMVKAAPAARRGKPMLKGAEAAKLARAERGTRAKKENLLKSAIQDAYEIFLEDPNTYQADKTKTYFAFNWLVSKCEEFEIVFDAWEGKDGLYRHRISGDEVTPGTARRWVK